MTGSGAGGARRAAWLACVAFGAVATPRALPARTPAAEVHDAARRLYRACIAAADARLRLHDAVGARHWLSEAPPAERGWEWRWLDGEADRSRTRLEPKDAAPSPVLDVALSPDGARLALARQDGRVLIYGRAAQEPSGWGGALTLEGHTGPVWSARFSPDGRRLATSSSDGTMRLWEPSSGRLVQTVTGIGRGIAALAWHPDGTRLATSSWDRSADRGVRGRVVIWDAATGGSLRTIEHGIKPITTVAFSPDGARLAAGTWDFDVAVWDMPEASAPVLLVPPASDTYKAVQGIAFSPDGTLLAVGAKDGTARVWDLAAQRLLWTLVGQAEGQTAWINDLAFSGDGRLLVTAAADGTLRTWSIADGTQRLVLHGHAGAVTSLTHDAAGGLISGGSDGSVRFWDAAALDPERRVWRPGATMYELAFSADGRRAAMTGWTGLTQIRDVVTGAPLASWTADPESGVHLAWSRDGRWLATSGRDARTRLWDGASGRPLADLDRLSEGSGSALAFHPDGTRLALTAEGGTVRVRSIPDGALVATLTHGQTVVTQVAWSPDGRALATAGDDGDVALWSWPEAREQRRLKHGGERVTFAFSVDGMRLAIGSRQGRISIWDAATGTRTATLAGHDQEVQALAWSPDGRRLASAGGDQTLRLWDTSDGGLVLTVPSGASVYHAAWSPDGARLAMLPLDGTVVVLQAPLSP